MLQWQVWVHLNIIKLWEVTPLLSLPTWEFPLLNPCITSAHTQYYFQSFFNTKMPLFVCLLVLPCTILLPGGKFNAHKRNSLINYQCWTAKLLKPWHSFMENKFIKEQDSQDYGNSESICLPQEYPSTQFGAEEN